ncbi:uncharacterized protein GVI51_M08173 [Nakaseomyces glabratus]|uniref:Protein LST4 n=1 Tax=Candida glabrata (strain ATCC 2001 / BCRC 20586 / JCM 3761 / NBRC 0622 / NRRL Y-65 / CBS 138) TaxID=284593 RepID=LST4_CANGA|nr:uncharacterized protein CAGL0M08228g [Nakaseomyces glabratus]Q6FJ91.1 RecName: Full=Protein LST4 [Nakaseomyces glabratus CBS 138]KAH7579639.1 Tripartite DENN FNIP1/2-type domain profile [Nakaseomyces glabratus]KAH7592819.1 Tripartite DENN FNIP1/2-type domain profile [Nakaseomyces glabratus]KAH7593890.1 Tripartite DENN FNIP1/2-type domain profile [Nakaseomyces glabratus]KAH7600340.1 Tripartite DENN FNIP1/2-type domain profile [Nakaseomyces glabratus]KAH7610664.1 Tripartite DENN FNIP1/2-type|eukprot:XP_449703.1 uncharacterized protein CAGL0M08228g [[Candida] glabrata]
MGERFEGLENLNDECKVKLFGCRMRAPGSGTGGHESIEYRLLILEENAEMVCRQRYRTILDYSSRGHGSMGLKHDEMTNGNVSAPFITASELRQYIYGSPIRSKTRVTEDKFRIIPNSRQLLITRVFYPRRTSMNLHGTFPKNYQSSDRRVSITMCLPSYLLADISDSWADIDGWLTQTERHLMATSFHVVETQDNFVTLVNKLLIPALRSCHEIPRLFLYPQDNIDFIHTWFKDVFNWIELKEGTKLSFLPFLIAKTLIEYRDDPQESECHRIVITSGNLVIANKLVFILGGLLKPRYDGEMKIMITPVSTPTPSNHLMPPSMNGSNESSYHSSSNSHTPSKLKIPATINEHRPSRPRYSSTENIHVQSRTMDIPIVKSDQSPFSTSRGWKIPSSYRSATSSVSISSDESLAEVIQPSSLKSTTSIPFQNFSSSLSNQLYSSSYGSWFNGSITGSFTNSNPLSNGTSNMATFSSSFKKNNISSIFQSNSPTAGTDSWERPENNTGLNPNITLQRTASNSSLRHMLTPYQQQLISPSTNSEYDEYPWFGATNNAGGATVGTSSETVGSQQPVLLQGAHMDTTTLLDSIRTSNNNGAYTFPLKNVGFDRDCSSLDHHKLLTSCFEEIFEGDIDANKVTTMVPCSDIAVHIHSKQEDSEGVTSHPRVVIDVDIPGTTISKYPEELLPRYTMYLSHFNPFFKLQAIPATNEIENKIVHGLKRDFISEKCDVSKTLFISMRSRSIKEIVVRKTTSINTPSNSSNQDPRNKSKGSMLKQKIKKVFSNGTCTGRVTPVLNNCVAFVEAALMSAMSLYSDPTIDKKYRDERILKIFLAVAHYNVDEV